MSMLDRYTWVLDDKIANHTCCDQGIFDNMEKKQDQYGEEAGPIRSMVETASPLHGTRPP